MPSTRPRSTTGATFLLSGLVDSLGVLELVGSLSEFCGFELDLDDLDPDDLTIVGPLCDYVTAQAAARSA